MLETGIGQKPNSLYSNSVTMISILKWVCTTRLSAFCHLEGGGGGLFLLALWEKPLSRKLFAGLFRSIKSFFFMLETSIGQKPNSPYSNSIGHDDFDFEMGIHDTVECFLPFRGQGGGGYFYSSSPSRKNDH